MKNKSLFTMPKMLKYYFLCFFIISSPVFSYANMDTTNDLSISKVSPVPDGVLDTGTNESIAGIKDVNIASEVTSRPTDEEKKLAEAKTVQREVDAVIGKRGRGVVGDFFFPTYHGIRLSYCTPDEKVCGKKLASRYCKLMGYDNASKAMIDHNVGLTRYPSTNLQCQGFKCDGFKLITCADSLKKKPTPVYYYRMRDFMLPRFENYRLDFCYDAKKGCGRRAANAFCRHKGYDRAKDYAQSKDVVATRTIGSGELCFGPSCKGFSRVTCYR
jgi:hypothetical protein